MQVNGIIMAVEDRIAACGSSLGCVPLDYLVDEFRRFNMSGEAAEILEAAKTNEDLHEILMRVLPGKSPDEQRAIMDVVELCVGVVDMY